MQFVAVIRDHSLLCSDYERLNVALQVRHPEIFDCRVTETIIITRSVLSLIVISTSLLPGFQGNVSIWLRSIVKNKVTLYRGHDNTSALTSL